MMAMQELEWHSIDDVDVEENELASVEDIRPEIGTPVLKATLHPFGPMILMRVHPFAPKTIEDD